MNRVQKSIVVLLVCLLALAAGTAMADEGLIKKSSGFRNVTIGVGYIPNVQFAPLYVAQHRGYYADEGLEVKIEYGFENDFVLLAAQGKREFAAASGDQIIMARSQGVPITYIMKWFQRYPVGVMSLASKGVTGPKDLEGLKIGLPGFFGSSYVGWKALVYATGIDEKALTLQEIGFAQAAAVQHGLVDAAVVYVTNEPIQMRSRGMDMKVIEVSDYIDLVSNGLVVGDKLMAEDPELVRKLVKASLRGLKHTMDNPDDAFAVVRKVIPEISDKDAPVQRKILDASIALWRTDKPGLSSRESWQVSLDFMKATGLLKSGQDMKVDSLYTNRFVDAP